VTISPWSDDPTGNLGLGGTVRDRVVATLRDRILSGQMPRGARIDLDALAKEFRTSRTPVREAVLGLAQEGLAHVPPRSRATVIGLTPQGVRDNFTVMSVLSGLAAELAADRATEEELAHILELGRALEHARGADLVRTNWSFHRAINRAAHSTPLLTQLGMSNKLVPQSFFAVVPEQTSNSRAEHRELVEGFATRDGARVRGVMEKHFRSAGELLSTHHADDEGGTETSA
jgi:DNA-binding GntR family transcriptional regulator